MMIFIVGIILVLVESGRRCWKTLHGAPIPEEASAILNSGQDGMLLNG
jgi:hypothetical protein